MQVSLAPGVYVVAVSGGVDSVVLLDLLSKLDDVDLVVAHFDHGIRPDSHQDKQLVETLSQKYSLPFVAGHGHLGRSATEEKARQARYKYLRKIRKKYQANAIVTAHHQDDALETLAFNVLRGTKRKGVSSLKGNEEILRPLLGYKKADIRKYAEENNLVWREDSTNADEKYSRNWIRRRLMQNLDKEQESRLVATYGEAVERNQEVDKVVDETLGGLQDGDEIRRRPFITLPYAVACEVMAAWLRQQRVKQIDRKLIDNLVVAVKTLPPGKQLSVGDKLFLSINARTFGLSRNHP